MELDRSGTGSDKCRPSVTCAQYKPSGLQFAVCLDADDVAGIHFRRTLLYHLLIVQMWVGCRLTMVKRLRAFREIDTLGKSYVVSKQFGFRCEILRTL